KGRGKAASEVSSHELLIEALASVATSISICSFIRLHSCQSVRMRKKRTLLLCAACALLVILAFLAFMPSHEPSYDGHPLSFWVAALATATPIGLDTPTPRDQLRKATNAIDHIGVAALPFLMKWIQYEPAQWRLKLFYKLNAAPSPRARLLSRW